MSLYLVDSHCHLNFKEFQSDLDDVVKRAFDAGVKTLLTINTKLDESRDLQEISKRFDHVYCSVGVHPHDAEEHMKEGVDVLQKRLEELTHFEKTVGIGETGLDYYYNNSPRKEQLASFELHLECARTRGLPLIIHTRDADEDTISCIESFDEVRGVFHCFSGSYELAKKALDLGFYLSFSGIITFKKALELQDVVKRVPLDRILVETDAPFLAPVPYRGKRNEPSYTRFVADQVGVLKSIPLEEVAEVTTKNFFTLFDRARSL